METNKEPQDNQGEADKPNEETEEKKPATEAKATEEPAEEKADVVSDPEAPSLPSCQCGHTRDDHGKNPYIEAKGEWGAWGWFYLLIGITAIPKIVRFQCHKCRIVFDSTTDPELLKHHT